MAKMMRFTTVAQNGLMRYNAIKNAANPLLIASKNASTVGIGEIKIITSKKKLH